jgi:hypothetical protein
LDEYLDFYNCADLLPFINRVLWLNGVREALGHIPDWFELNREEIRSMVILREETSKKMQYDSNKSRDAANKMKTPPSLPSVAGRR